jgi:hypothetical protein
MRESLADFDITLSGDAIFWVLWHFKAEVEDGKIQDYEDVTQFAKWVLGDTKPRIQPKEVV